MAKRQDCRFKHELLKRQMRFAMNQQLVIYHVPAQMQVSAHVYMKFFGSEDLAVLRLAERSEEMSDPTVHKK